MNANENKTPIGFDMELTDEQLKDVSGGASAGTKICAEYKCNICGAMFRETFYGADPDSTTRVLHYKRDGSPCSDTVSLFDWKYV